MGNRLVKFKHKLAPFLDYDAFLQAFRSSQLTTASSYADSSVMMQVNIQAFSITHTTNNKDEDPDP